MPVGDHGDERLRMHRLGRPLDPCDVEGQEGAMSDDEHWRREDRHPVHRFLPLAQRSPDEPELVVDAVDQGSRGVCRVQGLGLCVGLLEGENGLG